MEATFPHLDNPNKDGNQYFYVECRLYNMEINTDVYRRDVAAVSGDERNLKKKNAALRNLFFSKTHITSSIKERRYVVKMT
jgi:hypothetical protein